MMLTRGALVATSIVAIFCALSAVVSVALATLWTAGWLGWRGHAARARASRLASLRLLPAAVLGIVTVAFVVPLFLALEPDHDLEEVGPALLIVATIGAVLMVRSLVIALRMVAATRRIRRQWLRNATPLSIEGVHGGNAYQIESTIPIVAVVGVWRPIFVAARSVIDACTDRDLANMARHERTHVVARDNFKRLLLACVPDVLSLTRVHRAIVAAWHDAAEDAADDAATGGDPRARVELAELLVKVARLAPAPSLSMAAASSFAEARGLERRVRRLVTDQSPIPPTPSDHVAGAILIGLALLISTLIFNAAAQTAVHKVVESAIAVGAAGR